MPPIFGVELVEEYITWTVRRGGMPRESYQEQLDTLREDVLYMSEIVLERLRLGLDALARKDEATAREVIEGDDEINRLYLDLEGSCIGLFALQQPVAGDLRFIASSFKIITDLERIGSRHQSRRVHASGRARCLPRGRRSGNR